jgi:hypothetical protein
MAAQYALVESALVTWFATAVPGVRCVTELPGNPVELATQVPLIQLTRFGGVKAGPNIDRPMVDVDCFHSTREEAEVLVEQISRLVWQTLAGTHLDVGNVRATFGQIREIAGVGWRSYENPNVSRYGFTVQLLVKSSGTPA